MISIIIASYNDYDFLKKCLPSCLKQDIEKEIILVDDCPDIEVDQEILNFIEENSVIYIKNQKNMGLGGSRNIGVNKSKYDFYLPLDSDDFLFDNALDEVCKQIDDNHDIFYANLLNSATQSVAIPFTGEINRNVLLRNNPIFSCSVIRKNAWINSGGYNEEHIMQYDDWNFWCKCFKTGAKFKYVPVDLFYHTDRSGGMCRRMEHDFDVYVKMAIKDLL